MINNRISTLNLYNNSSKNVMNVYKNLEKITANIASNNMFDDFASVQNVNDVQLLLAVNRKVQDANVYIQNASTVQMRTEIMDYAIGNLFDIANDLNSTMSMSTHSIERKELMQVATNKLDEIKSELNINIGSSYLFSGSMVNTQPIGDIRQVYSYYQGNSFISSAKISDSSDLYYGVTGDNDAFVQLITSANIAAKVGADDYALHEAKIWMEKAIENLILLQQEVRNNYATAASAREMYEDMKTELIAIRNQIEESYGLDIPQMITDFSIHEAILQSSQYMFAKLTNLTLTSYLG